MYGIARMQDRRRRRAERRKRIKNVLCIMGIILSCILIIGAARGKDRAITGYEYKSISTLWELLEYCPEDVNRWEYLSLVMQLNGMHDETVYANRLYMIPAFK